MNRLLGLIVLVVLVVMFNKIHQTDSPYTALPPTVVEQPKPVKPKPKPLLAHEPHPADSKDIAEIRANYARRCTGAEPIEYTKDMCDAVLFNLNKIDFMRSLLRLACVIGTAESYGCRDELAQMKKEKEEAEEAERNAQ